MQAPAQPLSRHEVLRLALVMATGLALVMATGLRSAAWGSPPCAHRQGARRVIAKIPLALLLAAPA